jgi:hypothetical protein
MVKIASKKNEFFYYNYLTETMEEINSTYCAISANKRVKLDIISSTTDNSDFEVPSSDNIILEEDSPTLIGNKKYETPYVNYLKEILDEIKEIRKENAKLYEENAKLREEIKNHNTIVTPHILHTKHQHIKSIHITCGKFLQLLLLTEDYRYNKDIFNDGKSKFAYKANLILNAIDFPFLKLVAIENKLGKFAKEVDNIFVESVVY